MNPILQMLNIQNPTNNVMGLINALKQGNPDYMFQQMIKNNPQFKSFVDANKDKTVQEIADSYGIDINTISQLLR